MGFATLRTPFPSLTSDNFISRGSGGQVFTISANVVFKCATLFTDPAPEQARESAESVEKMVREKAVYRVLMKRQHRNIVRGILCAPEGIFLQRLECTLQDRLERYDMFPLVGLERQCQWIQELVSAMEWLESLGYAHGDMRPANVLLDAAETIKVGDFDSTVKIGEPLLVTPVPFCKLTDDYEAPLASAISEQYAIGSCIYNIRTGHQPFYELDGPAMVRKLMKNEFPPTSNDYIFGDIILRCWRGSYQSVAEVEQAIRTQLHGFGKKEIEDPYHRNSIKAWSSVIDQALVAECEAFLRQERSTATLEE